MAGHFFLLRRLPVNGWQWTVLALMSIWFADMGAYGVGKFIAGRFILGRHPLAPRLSPRALCIMAIAWIVTAPFIRYGAASLVRPAAE